VACQELLPFVDRIYLKLIDGRGGLTSSDQTQLVQKVANLGAELSPTGLDDLWERAGGQRKHLSSAGSPDIRWREAAMQASRGALGGGALALLKELRRDFQHNAELRKLEEVMARLHHDNKR
jgi:hypothetical protein